MTLMLYLDTAEKDGKSYLTGAVVASKPNEWKHSTEVEVFICANLISFGGVLAQKCSKAQELLGHLTLQQHAGLVLQARFYQMV